MNYLGNLFPVIADVCEPLEKLTSAKTFQMWNDMYQKLYEKVKAIIKDNVCMTFCNEKVTLLGDK